MILNLVTGGSNISAKIDPILNPTIPLTTSFLKIGEVNTCFSLLAFAENSPNECQDIIQNVDNFLRLKLSNEGFGIFRAIELGKSLTEKQTSRSYYEPEKPTEEMKDKR